MTMPVSALASPNFFRHRAKVAVAQYYRCKRYTVFAGYSGGLLLFNHLKTVTFRLVQASKAYRQRSANVLAELNLHPGQDQILKALADNDGQTMGSLAHALSVQPPTITKMVSRLGGQGLVDRRPSLDDGRSSRVFLTDKGRNLIDDLDARLKRMERDALKGFSDKDRKRLRKALRQLEENLSSDLEPDRSLDEASLDAAFDAEHGLTDDAERQVQ